jgi:hypothetical protein
MEWKKTPIASLRENHFVKIIFLCFTSPDFPDASRGITLFLAWIQWKARNSSKKNKIFLIR